MSDCACLRPNVTDHEWCRTCEEWCLPDEDGSCPGCWNGTVDVDPRPGCDEHAHLLDRWCPACEEWAGRFGWEQGGPFDCSQCGSPTAQNGPSRISKRTFGFVLPKRSGTP